MEEHHTCSGVRDEATQDHCGWRQIFWVVAVEDLIEIHWPANSVTVAVVALWGVEVQVEVGQEPAVAFAVSSQPAASR